MNILVAEDDLASRRLLEATLLKWGYSVVACADGLQAWQLMRCQDPPEIAILDWMMPGLDGPEVCRRVRRSPNSAAIYIILLTARDAGDDVIAGLDAGADDYISKPFDLDQLRARVRVGERAVELQRQRLRRETASYVGQLERAVADLKRSRRRIVAVQEEAKKALAEELHGPVQTRMYMLYLKLGEVRDMIDTSPQQARADLAQAAAELDSIRENEIRMVSHRLHPSIIDVGLGAGIRSLRDKFEEQVPISLEIGEAIVEREPPGSSSLPFDVRLGLYRVVEEALGNVIKHSGASSVSVHLRLDESDGSLSLAVEDNGCGFDHDAPRPGLGMVTMEDHLGALGGSLQVDSAPGKGTGITATVPLDIESIDLAAD